MSYRQDTSRRLLQKHGTQTIKKACYKLASCWFQTRINAVGVPTFTKAPLIWLLTWFTINICWFSLIILSSINLLAHSCSHSHKRCARNILVWLLLMPHQAETLHFPFSINLSHSNNPKTPTPPPPPPHTHTHTHTHTQTHNKKHKNLFLSAS